MPCSIAWLTSTSLRGAAMVFPVGGSRRYGARQVRSTHGAAPRPTHAIPVDRVAGDLPDRVVPGPVRRGPRVVGVGAGPRRSVALVVVVGAGLPRPVLERGRRVPRAGPGHRDRSA